MCVPEENYEQNVKSMRTPATRMPMKYIGRSISQDFYSIFQFESCRTARHPDKIDLNYLIGQSGTFSIPLEYFRAFTSAYRKAKGPDSALLGYREQPSGTNIPERNTDSPVGEPSQHQLERHRPETTSEQLPLFNH